MYALARNAWKFQARDQRVHKEQNIEFDYLAPDTVEEMFAALELLERWVGRAWHRRHGGTGPDDSAARARGRELLDADSSEADALEVLGERIENSRRKTVILKARQAWAEYRKMIHYYAVANLMNWLEAARGRTLETMRAELAGSRATKWANLGGQLVAEADLKELKRRILSLETWPQIHGEYDRLWAKYPEDKARHAFAALMDLHGLAAEGLTADRWRQALDQAVSAQSEIAARTCESRAKDYESPFRKITFSSAEEMAAVMGRVEENGFVLQVREQAKRFAERAAALQYAAGM